MLLAYGVDHLCASKVFSALILAAALVKPKNATFAVNKTAVLVITVK